MNEVQDILRDELISFSTAKLAKDKGFCNGSDGCYVQFVEDYICDDDPNHPGSYKKDEIRFYEFFHRNDFNYDLCEAPTQTLLRRWLRQKHNIYIDISHGSKDLTKYAFHVYRDWNELTSKIIKQINEEIVLYDTFEEALENGLQTALNFISYGK